MQYPRAVMLFCIFLALPLIALVVPVTVSGFFVYLAAVTEYGLVNALMIVVTFKAGVMFAVFA